MLYVCAYMCMCACMFFCVCACLLCAYTCDPCPLSTLTSLCVSPQPQPPSIHPCAAIFDSLSSDSLLPSLSFLLCLSPNLTLPHDHLLPCLFPSPFVHAFSPVTCPAIQEADRLQRLKEAAEANGGHVADACVSAHVTQWWSGFAVRREETMYLSLTHRYNNRGGCAGGGASGARPLLLRSLRWWRGLGGRDPAQGW